MSSKEFFQICLERDLIQSTSSNDWHGSNKISSYIGFDGTSDSLHIGSLIPLMMLKRLEDTGNKAIFLLGGATSLIGDPSGKSSDRQILSSDQIETNKLGLLNSMRPFMSKSSVLLDNLEWFKNINLIEFLRTVGPHLSVNRMMSMDSVKNRLERDQHLSFLEFSYMGFQAFDFAHLAKNHGVTLQMGGSDQWGNILMGIELARRLHNISVFGLTMPLLLTSDGKKMGKSENGAIWLDSSKTSVFDFWQFWRNTNDADVVKMLRLLTDVPMDEIRRLESLRGQEINDAKIILADFITNLVHGQIALKHAKEQAKGIFETANKFPEIFLDHQISIIDFLVKFGGTTSKSQAKRDIEQGGVKIDGRNTDVSVIINKDCLVSIGKKRFFKVILEKN